MTNIEPTPTQKPAEPTVIAHTIQVVLAGLGIGQWELIDNPTVNIALTVVWLVLGGLVARKNRAQVRPVPTDPTV